MGTEHFNTLHRVAEERMTRVMDILLQRPDVPPFGRDESGQSFTCIAADYCDQEMLRICLEAHRIHGTLHEALESPCQTYDGRDILTKPLLEHVIVSRKGGVTPEAKVATARLLVKEFGADPLACYPDFTDVASHLHTAASLAQVELMEFLILGTSSAFFPFPSIFCLMLSGWERRITRCHSHHSLA